MAFPQVQTTNETSDNTIATNHTLNLPSGITSGDLLIVLICKAGAVTTNAVTGWTDLADDGATDSATVLVRTADGTEGATLGITLSVAERAASIAHRISGAENIATTMPTISTVATGSSTAPDASNCNPGVSNDYLWLTFFVQSGEEANDDTWCNSAPTNYTGLLQSTTGITGTPASNTSLASATRQLTASAEDAGAFNTDQSLGWRAWTIAVPPAAAAASLVWHPGMQAALLAQ